MANIHRGEVTVSVAGRAYTLRPTFHILCQIEERIGLNILQLLQRIQHKGLLASEIVMILAIASQHDGSSRFDSKAVMDMPANKVDLHGLMPALAQFLIQAVGGRKKHSEFGVQNSGKEKAEGLDYAVLMETAYKILRLEPSAFWQLTMPEFRLLLRAARPRREETSYPAASEIAAMMQRFPDAAQI